MPPAGLFEPETPTSERVQTRGLDRAAIGVGKLNTARTNKKARRLKYYGMFYL